MKTNRNFLYITLADFLARSAYQMGKTPLLPIFAATLGASDAFLGVIVSVSTLTGMFLKPLVGILSDRGGRRLWLLIGTAFFAFMPFVYWLVDTPTHLFFVRIVHGLATAIYGPVTLAYVTEQAAQHKAERLGWFGMARSGGYIVGPALAGWLLLWLAPVVVFTIIGFISCVTFVPILALPETNHERAEQQRLSLVAQVGAAVRSGSQTPAIWLSGGLEATTFIALYAVKAFLPLYALSIGVNTAVVGLFFSVQEGVHMLLKPAGGRFGDRRGYLWIIGLGMLVLSLTLPLLTMLDSNAGLLGLSVFMGVAQALIFPCTVALISAQIDGRNLGAGMGLLGTLQNMGKVIGPVLGGFLIARFDYAPTFYLLAAMLFLGALVVWLAAGGRMRPTQRPEHVTEAGD